MNVKRLKIGAALVLTSPFVPMLFQGEEWGATSPFLFFTDYQDRQLAEAVRQGRRKEFAAFGWKPEEIADPQAVETFQRSKLNWPEMLQAPHAELLEWHRELIRLRRAEPELRNGRMDRVRTSLDEQKRWLLVERGPISVVCNFGERPVVIPLRTGRHKLLLASEALVEEFDSKAELPPESVAILKKAG